MNDLSWHIRKQNRYLFHFISFIIITVSLMSNWLFADSSETNLLLQTILFMCLLALPVILRWANRETELLEPINFVVLIMFCMFCLYPLVLLASPVFTSRIFGKIGLSRLEGFTWLSMAARYAMLGVTLVYIGYFSPFHGALAKKLPS